MEKQKIIFISGPSCSGKSTIVKKFSEEMVSYIENIENNPHISDLQSQKKFNAFKSQMWFINTMHQFIASTPAEESIIVDQSPEAIVYTYSKFFLDKNLINKKEFSLIEAEYFKVKNLLRSRNYRSISILLDASAEDLYCRAKLRDKNNAMSQDWFSDINSYFINHYMNTNQTIKLKTSNQSLSSLFEEVRKIVEKN